VLKKILTALGILILVFVVVGALLSREYRVTRSVLVKSEPAKIHTLVGDLKRWDEWTPWKEADPTIVTTFGPSTMGVGASQSWTGTDGAGRLTFTKCDPATGVACDMALMHGDREMPSRSWISYAPASGGTQVEWGIEGVMDMPVIGGYFARASDMLMGSMFEKGLEKLKSRAEGS